MLQYLVFIGTAIQFVGFYYYLRDTLKGETKPNKVSFLLWSIAPLIATAAALSNGVRWAVLPVFTSGFCPLLIFIFSFVNKKAYWKLETFDYSCGFFSILALVLWAITRQPIVAIIFAIISDGFATVPTLLKSWKFPETETGFSYIASLLNSMTSFAAIKIWNFSSFAFPIYLVVFNGLIVLAIYRRNILRKFNP